MSYHGRFEQAKQPKKDGQPRKKMGAGKIVLIVLAVLLALLLVLAGVAVWYYNHMMNKMNIVTLPEDTYVYTEEATHAEDTLPPVTETEETTEATAAPTVHTMNADDIVNILVVGQASRAGEESHMADTTMLISINTYTKELTVFSVLRDSFVKPPYYVDTAGGKHDFGRIKFTTVYNLGYTYPGGVVDAMALTNSTLRDNFGVEVDYNVEISFDGFIKIIDYIGGVDIELSQAEADYLNKDTLYVQRTIGPGVQRLMGMEALSYARMRKAAGDSESDIKRTERQRKLIESLLERFRNYSITKLQNWLDILLPMVTTTMTPTDIAKLAADVFPILSDMKMTGATIPMQGWGDMVDIYEDGMIHSVMRFDSNKEKKLIRAITEAEIAE